jgi:hypothetical protein
MVIGFIGCGCRGVTGAVLAGTGGAVDANGDVKELVFAGDPTGGVVEAAGVLIWRRLANHSSRKDYTPPLPIPVIRCCWVGCFMASALAFFSISAAPSLLNISFSTWARDLPYFAAESRFNASLN